MTFARPTGTVSCAIDPQNNEEEFVARLRQGDGPACEQLVREHSGRMYAAAARFLRCEQDRDDAVQDAFISAFRNLTSFKADARLSTWLHRITVNACLMKLRSQRRRDESSIEDLLPSFDSTGHQVHGVQAWIGDASAELLAEETRRFVRGCIDRLPEPYREVLLLRDIHELDTDEAAETLGISIGAVKTRLHRARQALRTLLEPHFLQNGSPEPLPGE